MLNTEQFTATQKANFETMMSLTAKAFEGVEQLTALNLQVVKTSLDEATDAGRAVLSAKDPQALIALQATLLQPSTEKAAAYGKQVVSILSAIKSDVETAAAQQAAAAQGALTAMVEAAGKNAPVGTGNGTELFKTAMAAANNAFETLQKAGRHAAETVEANVAAVTGTAVKAASKAKRS